MRSPFPRWANAAVRGGIGCLLVALAAVPLALMGWVRTPWAAAVRRPLAQPVEFDHRHHVVDDRIDCLYCHATADRAAPAGMPSATTCMSCHNQVWPESPLLEPVRESWFADRPVAWRRVHRVPDFVFFDHGVHAANGVGCVSCHGRVDRMARVHQVEPLTMSWCLDCHRDPAPHLRPPEAITALEWSPPTGAERAELARELARRYAVRTKTNCTHCHR